MEIVHNGPVPPYRQIARWLRDRIQAGEFAPDRDPLPSRKAISQETGVALTTVDRALAVLEEDGLAYPVPGRGWFVRPAE